MEAKKIPRREREKQAQRQEILAAALDLFSTKGYGNVSMCEIAERAEFAIGTLYKFFESKEDLYRVLLLEQATRIFAAAAASLEGPADEAQKLREFVRVKERTFRENAAMIRLYFSETHGARHNVLPGFASEIRKMHRDFLDRLAAVFRSGFKRRRFRKIAEPNDLAIALEGMTNAFLFRRLERPERPPPAADPETILDILFKGLLE